MQQAGDLQPLVAMASTPPVVGTMDDGAAATPAVVRMDPDFLCYQYKVCLGGPGGHDLLLAWRPRAPHAAIELAADALCARALCCASLRTQRRADDLLIRAPAAALLLNRAALSVLHHASRCTPTLIGHAVHAAVRARLERLPLVRETARCCARAAASLPLRRQRTVGVDRAPQLAGSPPLALSTHVLSHSTTRTQHNTTRHGSAHPGERAARRCPRTLPYRSIACQFAKRVRDREGERAKERGAERVLQKMALVVLLRGREGGMAPPPQQRALLAWRASCVQRQRDSTAPSAAPRPPPSSQPPPRILHNNETKHANAAHPLPRRRPLPPRAQPVSLAAGRAARACAGAFSGCLFASCAPPHTH